MTPSQPTIRNDGGSTGYIPLVGILRFLSGKNRGLEISLYEGIDLVFGRGRSATVVLTEGGVSREHVRVFVENGRMIVEDLGSTNGTFLNGKRTPRSELQPGDRLLVGESVMEVNAVDDRETYKPTVRRTITDREAGHVMAAADSRTMGHSMVGRIEEIPIPDLLQLMATRSKSGVLVLRSQEGRGRVHFREGQVVFAEVELPTRLDPTKAFFRVLRWTHGTFELGPPEELESDNTFMGSTHALLMDGMRRLDEFNDILARLPDVDAPLRVKPMDDLDSMDAADLDIVTACEKEPSIRELLDICPQNDLEIVERVEKLLEKDILEGS